MDPVPFATVYRFIPTVFVFSGNRTEKRDGMHRDRDRKRDEGFSVHIYGIPFLTGIIPFTVYPE